MHTITDDAMAGLRLLQLVSPSLPVGAFTYSQGVEWAVECGWIRDEADLGDWVGDLMRSAMAGLDLPVLARLYRASANGDDAALAHWSRYLLASRETRELRDEERNRGRALASLLPELGLSVTDRQMPLLKDCQLAGFAHAAACWRIPLQRAAEGYAWSWLENLVLAGVKIVPLGQTAGQRLTVRLSEKVPGLVQSALALEDEEIGVTCHAQALASSLHETQYTRIYRS